MYVLLIAMLGIIIYLLWIISKLKIKLDNKINSKVYIEDPVPAGGGDSFFVSEEAKIIFALLYLDGEERAKLLGITEEMYESADLAKSWRSKIAKQIYPDRCTHPQATEAMAKINSIYARMKKYAQ